MRSAEGRQASSSNGKAANGFKPMVNGRGGSYGSTNMTKSGPKSHKGSDQESVLGEWAKNNPHMHHMIMALIGTKVQVVRLLTFYITFMSFSLFSLPLHLKSLCQKAPC